MAIKHIQVMNEINKVRKIIRLSSLKCNVHRSVTYIITDSAAGGLVPLSYCLPVDTSELGTGSGLLSEETAGISVGDDYWLLLDDDDDDDVFFCWCNDVFDRSLEDGVSLSKEDCGDLACDVLREGQCWRHKLLAMTRFWWSSCGNRPCDNSSASFAAFISACWILWPDAFARRSPRKYTATVYTLVFVGPLHSITL